MDHLYRMGAQDAANWATILAFGLGGLIAISSLIFWLTAMYLNGRATRKTCQRLERRQKAQGLYIRRHARKSDTFHEQANVRLENHEQRIIKVEQAVGADTELSP